MFPLAKNKKDFFDKLYKITSHNFLMGENCTIDI
jgi:hypothetical protein